MTPRRKDLLIALLVGFATLIAYIRTARDALVWDDEWLTTRNPYLASPSGWLRMLTTDLWTASGMHERSRFYRPLASMSFVLNRLAGNTAASYHVGNVVIHACVAALAYAVIAQLAVCSRRTAAASALLFALAPIVSEPVAWVSGRFDPLSAAFALIAVLANGRNARVGTCAAVACALVCKESMIVLPIALWTHDHVVLRRSVDWRKAAGLVAIAAGYLALRGALGISSMALLAGLGLAGALRAWSFTAGTLAPLTVASHGFDPWHVYQAPELGTAFAVVVATACLLGISALVVRSARESAQARVALFGIVWALVFLALPALTAPTLGIIGDRYAYVSMVGVAFLAASLGGLAEARLPRAAPFVIACLALVRVPALESRLRAWTDLDSLCAASLEVDPDNFMALTLRGTERAHRSDLTGAESDFARARDRGASTWRAFVGLCYVHIRRGFYRDAEEECRAALQRNPEDPRAWLNLASALVNDRKPREAIDAATQALAVRPTYAEAHYVRALAEIELEDFDTAHADLETTLEIDPQHAQARKVLERFQPR